MNNRNNRKRNANQNGNKGSRNFRPRKRRVNIDRDVEVILANNSFNRVIYDNPRISDKIDMRVFGDEEYITVGDLRVMVNSSRSMFESFTVLIVDILDERYTLSDLLIFLGLDKKYDEFFSMTSRSNTADVANFQQFIQKSSLDRFERLLESSEKGLKNKIIETTVAMFKLGKFSDYSKMQVVRSHTNDDLFLDAEDTEIDIEI